MPVLNLNHHSVPPSLHGPVACDNQLVPHFWATVWLDGLRISSANSTRARDASALNALYQTSSTIAGQRLDQALASHDYHFLQTVLGAHLQRLNNAARQKNTDLSRQWQTCLNFIENILNHLGNSDVTNWEKVKSHLYRLAQNYASISPSRSKQPAPLRSLPANVISEMYNLFDPLSPDNPFKTDINKTRNFLIFVTLLHLGLRRSELLVLPVDALQTEFDVDKGVYRSWLVVDYIETDDDNDDAGDPRANKPSLKNLLARRSLPVARELAQVINLFNSGYRRRSEWPHLILSQRKLPLSPRQLNAMFETVTARLSQSARSSLRIQGKLSVQPHDLRHTCAVRRLTGYKIAGYSHTESIERARVFFGWGENSPMPARYARAYYETDFDTVWQDNYDSYVDAIRSLETVE